MKFLAQCEELVEIVDVEALSMSNYWELHSEIS